MSDNGLEENELDVKVGPAGSSKLSKRASAVLSARWSVSHPVKIDPPPKKYLRRRFFKRFRFKKGEDASSTSDEHIVHLNDRKANAHFPSNVFTTSKYTLLSWVPYNLWEQLRRVANTYFFVIFAMQVVPGVSPFPLYITALPLAFILGVTLFKEGYEDLQRHISDHEVNSAPVVMLDPVTGRPKTVKSRSVRVGDIICLERDQVCAADIVVLATEHSGNNKGNAVFWVSTANLDGETRLKVRRAVALNQFLPGLEESEQPAPEDLTQVSAVITSDPPNPYIEVFSGRLDSLDNDAAIQLSRENLVLRGAVLKNTKKVWGVVVGAGAITKLRMNQQLPVFKFSHLERQLNVCLAAIFAFQTVICVIMATLQVNDQDKFRDDFGWGFPGENNNVMEDWVYGFMTWFILCSFMIPMSLYVILELGKMMGGIYIHYDATMYSRDGLNRPAKPNTTSLVEELGFVEYVLTDKTGTLTDNEMRFTHCATTKGMYEMDFSNQENPKLISTNKRASILPTRKSVADPMLKQIMLVMAACNELEVEHDDDGLIEYSGESPDEVALTNTANQLGYALLKRGPKKLQLEFQGKNVTKNYNVLGVLPFNSSRKRMGIVIQEEGSKKASILYKGADNIMFSLFQNQKDTINSINEHVFSMSKLGLRTLVLATATMDTESAEFQAFLAEYREATLAMENRDDKVGEAFMKLEGYLECVGCTGVEDKLSDGVEDALQSLVKANIQVAVLTGDKTETAYSICTSCGLFKQNGKVHMVTTDDENFISEYLSQEIDAIRQQKRGNNKADVEEQGGSNDHALVISGDALRLCLEDDDLKKLLVGMMKVCYTTVCTRMTPKQKAAVTKLVREQFGVVTLSIGDGANDVSMIREADVGVGVFGKEGAQAVNSADFAIHKFADLKALLFVHGSMCKLRISTAARGSLFANMAFNMPQVLFGIVSGYSGQSIEIANVLTFVNLLMTGPFLLTIACFERELLPEFLVSHPTLYNARAGGFGLRQFAFEIGMAWWYAAVAFGLTFSLAPVWVGQGIVAGMWAEGTLLTTIIVLSILVTLGLRYHLVTIVHAAAACLGFFVFVMATLVLPEIWSPNATDNGFVLSSYLSLSGFFWLAALCGVVTSVFPYWTVKSYYALYKPTLIQVLQEQIKLSKNEQKVMAKEL